MPEKEKVFSLLRHQAEFVNSGTRYTLNSGGVGSGKTYSICLKTLALLEKFPGIFILIGAQTYPLLRDTTLREFLSIAPPECIKQYNKTEQHFWWHNGSEVIFRPFDDENKLKSLNLGAVGIEEMTDVKENIFKMLRTRLRQNGMPGYLYGATNPGTFGNWVYKYFIDTPIDDSSVVYSSSTENDFLPAEYLKDLHTLKKSNPEYYERMVMGRWGSLEGLIYNLPMSQRVIPNRDKSKYHRVIAGLDFGYNHPTAMVIFGVIEDTYYQVAELYRREMTAGDIITEVKGLVNFWGIDTIYCDSARPEIIEDLCRSSLPAEAAVKDVFDGIMYVKGLITTSKICVDESCHYTFREYDSYIWDAKNAVKEIPVKTNDDIMDATRYALYSDAKKLMHFNLDMISFGSNRLSVGGWE